MGMTAENVAERCKVTREAQDEWAALSQQRAVAARESGHFDPEIVGVDIPETHDAGGDVIPEHTVTRDDGPRAGTTVEGLSKLKPAFGPKGTVTAGNACRFNDGAAAVLVMSGREGPGAGRSTREHRIVASAVAAIRPEMMGLGPDPGGQEGAEAGRSEDRRHRRDRAQRGVRSAGAAMSRRARHRPREAEHQRRRDRAGSSLSA